MKSLRIFLGSVAVMIFTQGTFAFMKISDSVKDCKLSKDSVTVHKAVVKEALPLPVEKVKVRGVDERVISENRASFPLECKGSDGRAYRIGSLNLISSTKVMSIMHNFLDVDKNCISKPQVKLSTCVANMGRKKPKLKINSDSLEKQCLSAGDSVVEFEFAEGFKVDTNKTKPYEIDCNPKFSEMLDKDITVRAGTATNLKDNPKLKKDFDPGFNSIEGAGKILKIDKEKSIIYYDADTGGGMSGGALEHNGKLIGIHVGDTVPYMNGIMGSSLEYVGRGFLVSGSSIKECNSH